MKKYILLVVSAVALAFTSCSDKEEIDINYQTKVSISVNELMTPFKEVELHDFDIREDVVLRIQSYVYNEEGVLVKSCVSSVDDYSDIVSYTSLLSPGDYKVVSIADFISGNLSKPDVNYWEITGIDNINTLKISSGLYIGTWIWETLGVVVDNFRVSDKGENINVSILPVTALYQININLSDKNGNYSVFAPYCTDFSIHSYKQNDNISDFQYGILNYFSGASQTTWYNVYHCSPMEFVNEGIYKSLRGYRALLPQSDKTFLFRIRLLLPDGKVLDNISEESNAIDIKAGKQYALNLDLESLTLTHNTVNTDKNNINERLDNTILKYNTQSLDYSVNNSYKVLDIAIIR